MIAIFPKIAEVAGRGDIEHLSCLVRSYFGGSSAYAPQFHPEVVVENMEIPFEKGELQGIAAIAGQDLKGRFSFLMKVNRNVYERMDLCAQRFLVGHLLGHYFLHLQSKVVQGEMKTSGYGEDSCPLARFLVSGARLETSLDSEADRFAAALLLPLGMTRRALEHLGSHSEVASFFDVSEELVAARLASHEVPNQAGAESVEEAPRKRTKGKPGEQSLQPDVLGKGMDRIREIARMLDKSPRER